MLRLRKQCHYIINSIVLQPVVVSISCFIKTWDVFGITPIITYMYLVINCLEFFGKYAAEDDHGCIE